MEPRQFTVSTWNVLADCYVHGQPRSADAQAGQVNANKHLDDKNPIAWKNRSHLIAKCLRECNTDVLCLQEVDHYKDFYKNYLKELGYRPCFVQRPNRQDGCVIAFKTSKFTLIDLLRVNCDDSITADSLYEHQKYQKHNVALFLHLRSLDTSKDIIVATCHIHWNPLRPEVKVSQIAYILQRLKDFQGEEGENGAVPVVLTGDFNTLPKDPIYHTLTDSTFNKNNNIAALDDMLHQLRYGGELYGPNTRFLCDASLSKLCKWLRVLGVNCALDSWDNGVPASSTKHRNAAKWQWTSPTPAATATTSTAVDCATVCPPPVPSTTTTAEVPVPATSISTSSLEAESTPGTVPPPNAKELHRAQFPVTGDPTYASRVTSINAFFARAEREKRVILTTSKSLRERASCPKSFFIQAQKLEQGLIDIAVNFGLNLSRDRFLTVCGKCGDDVEEVNRTIDIENNTCIIHDERLEDKYMPLDRTVFACVNCAQPYWWNEKAGSLPALAMERAEQLYLMVCNGIEKRKKNGPTGGAVTGTSDVEKVDTNMIRYMGNAVETPVIYRQDESITTDETADGVTPAPASINTITATPSIITTATTGTFKITTTHSSHQKAVVKAGTCILKDFGRTAKNPTLKNLAINSDSVNIEEKGKCIGSRSNSKSAELELELSRQLSKVVIADSATAIEDTCVSASASATATNSSTSSTSSTSDSPVFNDSVDATATTTATTTSAPMSMAELSLMFENRERNVKLARENSGSTTAVGDGVPNGALNSTNRTISHGSKSEGLPLQSVFQLVNRQKGEDEVTGAAANDMTVSAEPELTNWNGEFKGTLDYIFVSDNISLASSPLVLPTIHTSTNEVTVNRIDNSSDSVLKQVITTPQPSRMWPSDHFIVTATLQY